MSTLILIALLTAGVSTTLSSPAHVDGRIRRALEWLPRQPAVPVDVVDVGRLAPNIARSVRRACGFIVRGEPRIYIVSGCWAYQRSEHSPFDAIALAGVIAHEMAHLEGADETEAREVEINLVRDLMTYLPGSYRVRAATYVADLRQLQRQIPVRCRTNQAAATFHTCAPEAAPAVAPARER